MVKKLFNSIGVKYRVQAIVRIKEIITQMENDETKFKDNALSLLGWAFACFFLSDERLFGE